MYAPRPEAGTPFSGADFRAAGINRLSVGLQSLDDPSKRDLYRRQLADAYSEFAAGAAPTAPAFPGLGRMGGGFVALSNVRRSKTAAPESKTSEGAAR